MRFETRHARSLPDADGPKDATGKPKQHNVRKFGTNCALPQFRRLLLLHLPCQVRVVLRDVVLAGAPAGAVG